MCATIILFCNSRRRRTQNRKDNRYIKYARSAGVDTHIITLIIQATSVSDLIPKRISSWQSANMRMKGFTLRGEQPCVNVKRLSMFLHLFPCLS